jgi:hypothetical protein
MVRELRWAFKLKTYGYELPATDARKPNKQYIQNVWLQREMYEITRTLPLSVI